MNAVKLDFDDQTFAGYWSLGVIEHFWDGYAEIADEAFRVLKPGGIMFLVFPYLNPVRAWKGYLHILPRFQRKQPNDFYQFALNSKTVLKEFRELGFELVESRSVLARQGFAEEFPRLSKFMERLYRSESRSTLFRAFRRVLHALTQSLMNRSHYSNMLVLRKPKPG